MPPKSTESLPNAVSPFSKWAQLGPNRRLILTISITGGGHRLTISCIAHVQPTETLSCTNDHIGGRLHFFVISVRGARFKTCGKPCHDAFTCLRHRRVITSRRKFAHENFSWVPIPPDNFFEVRMFLGHPINFTPQISFWGC